MAEQVIVVGGGLAGLSAAHTAIERGRRVTLIERNPFCGGNSTKATSGINGAPTNSQKAKNIQDSTEAFLKDVAKSAALGDEKAPPSELAKVLVYESAPAVEWLQSAFGLDLSILGRLGGHSYPRTHRGKEKFPGMTITYGLMEKFEKIEKESNGQKCRLINKATVTKLLDEGGKVVGVEYERAGQKFTEKGVVILATGGYGADFSENSLLKKYRPDVMHYSTTNGDHCNGSGIKLSQGLGGDVVDMEWVQVHPTGLVNPKDPNNKVKWLAAEALRGCGGIILNANGERFCDELGRRDYVTGMMNQNKGPFRLVLNGAASNEIEWHCKHYVGRGLMKRLDHGKDLAAEIGVPVSKIQETFDKYNGYAKNNNDPWGKKFFANVPLKVDDFFHVAQIVPVVHYTMGGIKISPENRVRKSNNDWVTNLWAVGEVSGGTHGKNRLGGNSLLDCVVHGRVAGRDVVQFVKQSFQPSVDVPQTNTTQSTQQTTQQAPTSGKGFTEADVAKHSSENDCWVILYDEVYNVTKFLDDHPGGKDSIMLYAGKDATEQFDMLHQRSVLDKFGKDMKIGQLLKPKL